MKKITLFIAAFIFAIGAFAQEDCSTEFLDGGGNAWGNFSTQVFANDFLVAENETFNLSSIMFYSITSPGVPVDGGVTLHFYEDTGGNGPGNELGMQEIPADAVDVQYIGDFADHDHSEITLDLNEPFEFEGSETGETTYWIGIQLEFSGDAAYIEVTEEFDTDTQAWEDGADPFGPFGEFLHTKIGMYGQCDVMSVEDFAIESFTHFIQNGQMTVESAGQIQEVAIYNLLGQEVIAENINATSGNINLGSLNAGVYLTKVNVDGNTKTFKFSVN